MSFIKRHYYLIKDKFQKFLLNSYLKKLNKKKLREIQKCPYQNGFPVFLLLFSFPLFHILFSTPVFATDANISANPASCASLTNNSQGNGSYIINVHANNSTPTLQDGAALTCFFNNGTVYLSQGDNSWGTNCGYSISDGDIVKCKYDGTNLKAYLNMSEVCSLAVSMNTTGTNLNISSWSPADFSNFSDCNTPESTPTPTPTTIPPTPTPTPTTEPTPTPTSTPTPTTYIHEFCVLPSDFTVIYDEKGLHNPTLPITENSFTNAQTGYGYSSGIYGGAVYFQISANEFNISPLDLETLSEKTFVGVRLYNSLNIEFTEGSEFNTIKQEVSTSPFWNSTDENYLMWSDDENSGEYSCNGKLGQITFEKTYSELFNENGIYTGQNFHWYIMNYGSVAPPSFTLNNFGMCFQYEDESNLNTITQGNTCTGGTNGDVVSCPPFLTDMGGWIECQISKFKNWLGSVLAIFPNAWNDTITQFRDWLIPDPIEIASTISALFLDFQESTDSNIVGIISAPLTVVGDLVTATCVPLDIPLPFTGLDIQLPCYRAYLVDKFPTFFVLYDLLTSGFIGYYAVLGIFKILKNAKDPLNDKIEVMDI